MTSAERKELRYQRRAAKRREKKEAVHKQYDNYDAVFTFTNLYNSYRLCRKGVSWKSSVQKYKANLLLNLYDTYQELKDYKFKSRGFYEFVITERGKQRNIKSVMFGERVVQRCLCDQCLMPLFARSFIYDNCASQKNKGVLFAINRMTAHLQQYYRRFGNQGYIFQYDFSKFFESLPHDQIITIINNTITDIHLKELITLLVKDFGDKGLGLGSQISQILALAFISEIDHTMKEKAKAKYYGRYMDDGYIISNDKEYLQECHRLLREMCDKAGIKLNEKKTRIGKLSDSFTYLKIRFFLTPSGKVVRRLSHDSIVRMRRKLKKLKTKVEDGTISVEDVARSFNSWYGHAIHFDSYKSRENMRSLFNSLFGDLI